MIRGTHRMNLLSIFGQSKGVKLCHINNNDIVRQKDITGENDPVKWYDDYKWTNDIKNKLIDI